MMTRSHRSIWLCLALAIGVGITSPSHAGLIAHFALDGNGNDSSGNGNHGTIFGGAAATINRFGQANQALAFDGLDDYVDVAQLLFNGNDATVAFWAKSAGLQNEYSVMVSQGHYPLVPATLSGFAFQYGWPSAELNVFIYGNGGGGWQLLHYPTDLELDTTWHHYAFTKSGNVIKNYFDGAFVSSSSAGLVFSTYGFNIGRDTYNADANHRTFNGSIDDVYVYNNALNDNQIAQLFDPVNAVPEPTSMALLGLASLGGLGLRLRRRRAVNGSQAA